MRQACRYPLDFVIRPAQNRIFLESVGPPAVRWAFGPKPQSDALGESISDTFMYGIARSDFCRVVIYRRFSLERSHLWKAEKDGMTVAQLKSIGLRVNFV
jgi:hypothetical protein